MREDDKIYIAGHSGMVGSAVYRRLKARGYVNLLTRSRSELELLSQQQVDGFFSEEKPDVVLFAAARVGGIHANNTFPSEFMYENLMAELNVIHAAFENGVKRFLFLGSSCIYPREAPQPMPESCLLTSPLEQTNEAFEILAENREFYNKVMVVFD